MPTEPPAFLALVLRRARSVAGLSQRDLARHSGLPLGTIAAVEAGRRDIAVTRLDALLRVCGWELRVVDGLGLPVDWLLDDPRRDRGARRYPAHVSLRSAEEIGSWWADRLGWWWGRPPRPDWTFDLAPRPYAGRVDGMTKVQRVGAYAVIVDSAGRQLLTRLTEVTANPGWWTLPGGGVDHGEHPDHAMMREVHEETGMRVRDFALVGVDSMRKAVDAPDLTAELHAIRIVYRATVVDEAAQLVHESAGSTDLARWVAPEEMAAMKLMGLVRAASAFVR
jgi:ADP-ribose pyrophosphatase YjhB (NUDIX family)/transcriptional regulator with XRE-family HTH domain